MTEPGQTDNYSITDHLEALFAHTGKEIDYCIADTGEIVPEYVRKYNQEGQDIVLQDIDKATKKGIKIIHKHLSKIEDEYIRHDSDVIASSIMELICNDLKFRDKESTPEYLLINSVLEGELKREKKVSASKRKNQRRRIKKAKREKVSLKTNIVKEQRLFKQQQKRKMKIKNYIKRWKNQINNNQKRKVKLGEKPKQ